MLFNHFFPNECRKKKVFSASFAEKRHTEHVWKLTIADSRYLLRARATIVRFSKLVAYITISANDAENISFLTVNSFFYTLLSSPV